MQKKKITDYLFSFSCLVQEYNLLLFVYKQLSKQATAANCLLVNYWLMNIENTLLPQM